MRHLTVVLILGCLSTLVACGQTEMAGVGSDPPATTENTATFGTIPPPDSDATPPDYLGVWNQEGTAIAGYVDTQDFLEPPGQPRTPEEVADYEWPIFEVYDRELHVVGYWVSRVGFVEELTADQRRLVLDS